MFSPRSSIGRRSRDGASVSPPPGAVIAARMWAFLWIGVLPLFLVISGPEVASAQAQGTMQATARVLPGRPAWAAFHDESALAQQVLASSEQGLRTHRAGLVATRAELASVDGQR